MTFFDMHIHLLYETDDGAKSRGDMFQMVDLAYKNGTRYICVTPHFFPEMFGDNRENANYAFSVLKEYCEQRYPDLKLFMGNEIYYYHDSISWIKNGLCATMGSTRYVLVEFPENASEDLIAEGILRLLNIGHIPILAHVERYKNLSIGRLETLRQSGVLAQMNAISVFGSFKLGQNKRVKTLLSEKLIDFVSTDAHDLQRRPPDMSKSYKYLAEKYGSLYAEEICRNNAVKIFCGDIAKEELA